MKRVRYTAKIIGYIAHDYASIIRILGEKQPSGCIYHNLSIDYPDMKLEDARIIVEILEKEGFIDE